MSIAADATSVSKSDVAYRWLRGRIARHEYGPGHRLVLGGIAEALDMSVVPVREAIRRLEAEGLVSFERNVGARVAVVDESEYQFTMQTLGVVEGVATALSAPLLSEAELAKAERLNLQLEHLLQRFDPLSFTRLNQDFHAVLFAPCPNPHILDLVHRGWGRLAGIRDSTFSFVPERARHSVGEHAEIIQLIRDGADPMDIELAARRHRWRTLDAFLTARQPGHDADPDRTHDEGPHAP